ncbi:epoxide hydrolase family protein [Paraburkholderia sp. BL21I4N1]|uniref:epoxide hydrolase family protein n=1 Tax=Paraburkholderia sp. BL21I4N1 TaxID=1938801 RepID=UPI000CFBE296|nr:epoxide hydrolase family protein [Paraburkholderia sp. BL21I4N1]PQV44386.1 pimeloyl-ACP methyl ester carboxylesterase [Paraburkholderia sp. BL21I4N1]
MPNTTFPESPSRRRFVGVAAAAVAAGSLSQLAFADGNPAITDIAAPAGGDKTALRPLRIHVPESQLSDLRRRIKATRWPDREIVNDDSQGVPLATIQTLAQHWATDYDWRKCEAKLNALPNFVTEIDGLDIHFIHVRSKHENAMPLIVTHGWPGSVIEQLKIVDPLTNPTAHGASASDAFHLVIPSLPGYGFSGKPTTIGWGPERTARAWVLLMKRLGYAKFAAQGGDLGGIVANVMAKQAPPELMGIHVNFPATIPPDIAKALQVNDPPPAGLSDDERLAYVQLSALSKRRAYALEQGTRPQTLYGLADSPIALASWLLDHPDGNGQPAAALTSAVFGRTINGHASGDVTLNDVLDDITLYWVTNTGVSAARFYWESHFNFYAAADVSIPAAVSAFPGENYQAPKSWSERAYHNLIYYNRPEKGGHFAAWEQPRIFAEEVRAGLRPLRT